VTQASDSRRGAPNSGDQQGRRRKRRRSRPVRSFDNTIPTPCIAVCRIDDRTGLCLGCYRSIDEIRDWPILTAEERTAVLKEVAGRKAPNLSSGDK